MIAVNIGTATKRVANLRVRTGSGTKRVQNAWIRTALGLKNLFGSITVSLDKTSVGGGVVNSHTTVAVTGTVTAAVTGGTGAISHSWSQVSGDSGFTINSPSSASTTFYANVDPGDVLSAVFEDTVTDATGSTATSPSVTATVKNIGGSTF